MSSYDDLPDDRLEDPRARARRETEELLAGFDRPGRSPRRPAGSQDFIARFAVGHEAGDGAAAPAQGRSPAQAPATDQVRPPTPVPPKVRAAGVPAWLAWASIALGLVAAAAAVAWLATAAFPAEGVPAPPRPAAVAPRSPSPSTSARSAHP